MIFKIALRYMSEVQYALYNVEMHASSQPPGYAEKVMAGVPEARKKMNVYMRKLLELPTRHNFSRYLIARIEELNGNDFGSVGIEKGALLWEFSDNPSMNAGYYLLDDLRPELEQIYRAKQGGGAAVVARTICTGLLVCAGGFTGMNDTTIQEMKTQVGIRVIYRGRYGNVRGLKPL